MDGGGQGRKRAMGCFRGSFPHRGGYRAQDGCGGACRAAAERVHRPDRAEHRQGVRRARRDERAAFDAAARRRLVGGRCRRELQKQIPGLGGFEAFQAASAARFPDGRDGRFRVFAYGGARRLGDGLDGAFPGISPEGFMEGADDGRLLLRAASPKRQRAGGAPERRVRHVEVVAQPPRSRGSEHGDSD